MQRLFVDVSQAAGTSHYTGIQRCVRHILRQACGLLPPGAVHAMRAQAEGDWQLLRHLPAHPMEGLPALVLPGGPAPIAWTAQDHVLLADRFWHTGAWSALDTLVGSSAHITLFVYDLLSLQQPQWFPPQVGQRFRRYLRTVLPQARTVVCLSHAVRHEVMAWCAAEGLPVPAVQVVHPGLDVWASGTDAVPAALPATWRTGQRRFVLQVGTLEPRKNHQLTLQAMEMLWRQGCDAELLLVGQPGWLTDALATQLRGHARVRWLTECTDAELQWCYRHAAALLYPSESEGYGLPIAEAAALGTPVVASDTPVHREVAAAQHATAGGLHLSALRADALAAAVARVLAAAPHRRPAMAAGRTWAQATRELLQAMEPAHRPATALPGARRRPIAHAFG